MKRRSLILAMLCLIALLASGCKGKTTDGEKTITLCVIHKDGTENEIEVKSAATHLEDVLKESGVVEGRMRSFGFYIETADGEKVNEDNEEWWQLAVDGEPLPTAASYTKVSDGDRYELIFTIGY